jgi:hypothetical protein
MAARGSRSVVRVFDESRVPAEERDRIKATWWDVQTAADYLGISRRQFDRKIANGSFPAGLCEDIDGVRYYNPQALAPLRTDGAPDVAPVKQDPALALWRSISDTMRAQNAGVADHQRTQLEFVRMFLGPIEGIVTLQRSEIERLQAENARLRDRVFAGLEQVEAAASSAAERDLRLVRETNRQQMLSDTFRVLRELAPRLLEQFAGIREVKKEIGKLGAAELVQLLPLVPEGARALLMKIHAEEQARTSSLEKTLRGSNGAAAETQPQQEQTT